MDYSLYSTHILDGPFACSHPVVVGESVPAQITSFVSWDSYTMRLIKVILFRAFRYDMIDVFRDEIRNAFSRVSSNFRCYRSGFLCVLQRMPGRQDYLTSD
jgi:hypothetical protein